MLSAVWSVYWPSGGVSHCLEEKAAQAGDNLTDCSQLYPSLSIRVQELLFSCIFFHLFLSNCGSKEELSGSQMVWNTGQKGRQEENEVGERERQSFRMVKYRV